MSLAHRITNYFSAPAAASPDPVAHSAAGLHNDGIPDDLGLPLNFSFGGQSLSDNMTPDEELEARPPILHVGAT